MKIMISYLFISLTVNHMRQLSETFPSSLHCATTLHYPFNISASIGGMQINEQAWFMAILDLEDFCNEVPWFSHLTLFDIPIWLFYL